MSKTVLVTRPAAQALGWVQRLREQVLRNLIDETLQIQEAAASKIEIEDSEVDESSSDEPRRRSRRRRR